MEDNKKSQAEAYREERKARLAKEAQKKAKRSPKSVKAGKIAVKVISIVLAVVLVLGTIGGVLNFFGAPQKAIKVTVDDNIKFSLAEFNYYYFVTWSNFYQTSAQYDQYYGAGTGLQATGYDNKKSPDAQEYKDDYSAMTGVTVKDLGVENPTWADVFKYATVNQITQIKFGANKATEAGLKLTEENKKEIDKNIEDARKRAKESDFSLDRFLRATYGNGVTEKLLRQVFTESYLATAYFEKLQKDMDGAITPEQIDAAYNVDKTKYDLVDVRIYQFSTTAPKYDKDATAEEKAEILKKAQEETKAKANAFFEGVTDEASFIDLAKRDILGKDPKSKDDADKKTSFKGMTFEAFNGSSEKAAKWAYDAKTAVGDKTLIELEAGEYLVLLMTKTAYKDMKPASNDVRHILVSFPETEKDKDGKAKPVTDAQKTETKAKADAILAEYLKNPTEDNFAKLAKEKSQDPGSKDNGGLYEGVNAETQFVEPFLTWTLDPQRKAGDTGIVETDYGYHIMFYSKGNGVSWSDTVKKTLLADQYSDFFSKEVDEKVKNVNLDSAVLNWTTKGELKLIKTIIVGNSK